MSGPAVVAFGGGHGLAASLTALRRVTERITAVVTVGDDGGSSGKLRDELGALPPGDLRMALAALAGDDEWGRTWQALLQHRFPGEGPLAGHAVGNLVLTGLAQTTGDDVAALDLVARLVGACGRVLPMSRVPLEIVADVVDGAGVERVVGQVAVATTTRPVVGVTLRPDDPPACHEAVEAVRAADWLVLGPGSWFTSVIPHLLVPELRDAVVGSSARRLLALNLAAQTGETSGFSPEAHVEALAAHCPDLRVDVVLADRATVLDTRGLMTAAESLGARLELADVAVGDGTPHHDPIRLADAYRRVMEADRPQGAAGEPAGAGDRVDDRVRGGSRWP